MIEYSKRGGTEYGLKAMIYEKTGKLPSNDLWIRWKTGIMPITKKAIPDEDNPDLEIKQVIELCGLYYHEFVHNQALSGETSAAFPIFLLSNRFGDRYERNPSKIEHDHGGGVEIIHTYADYSTEEE